MSTPARHAKLQSNNSLGSSVRKPVQGMYASGNVPLCSPQQVALRIQRLQQLCVTSNLDAVIVVLGIDGRYNLGSHQLAGYLLQGCCGRAILDCVKLPEDIEDNFLVIRPDNIYVYSNTPAVAQLSAVLRPCCSNLTLILPTEAQYDDPDELEELKVASLVQALAGVTHVGVSLAPEVELCLPQNRDVNAIEEWPLIQAYGLEGVGRSGFFSANFQVSNIYPQLQEVYAKLDGWSLQDLLSNNVPTLRQHCIEFKRNLMQKLPRTRGEATERHMAEPLLTYYTYGTLRRTVGVGQVGVMQPRVVSGSRSNDSSEMTDDVRLCDPDPSTNEAPVHLIMEAADPHSPIRVARTYFLSAGKFVPDIFSDEDDFSDSPVDQEDQSDRFQDTITLMRLYAILADSTLKAIKHFALQDGATVESTRALVVDYLVSSSASTAQPLSRQDIEQRLVFSLWSCDHANNVTSVAARGSMQLKVVRAAIKDIHSTAPGHRGALLGSVVYADTFMEIPAGLGHGPSLLNLTETVPMMVTTVSCGSEVNRRLRSLKAFHTKLQQLMQARQQPTLDNVMLINRNDISTGGRQVTSLGALLSVGGGDESTLLTGSPASATHTGVTYFFQYGLVFLPRTGPLLVLDVRYDAQQVIMQELKCPDTGLPPLGEALVIRCKAPSAGWAPACHLSDNMHLALPFATYPQSLRRNLLSTVAPAWQQACREAGVPWVRDPTAAHPFPPHMYPFQWFEAHKMSKRFEVVTPDTLVEEILQRLDNIELTEVGWCNPTVEAMVTGSAAAKYANSLPAPTYQQLPLSNRNLAPGTPPELEVNGTVHTSNNIPASTVQGWVTVVAGLPGAQQLLVSSVVASIASAQGDVPKVLTLPAKGAPWLEQELLVQELEPLLQPAATVGLPHVILAIASYDNLPQILTQLAGCPSLASGRVQLRACITCITTHGIFDGDTKQQPLPGLLDQVVPGLVDAVVLGGFNAGAVQQLVQLRDPHVPILKATWSQLMAARSQLLPPYPERMTKLKSAEALLSRRWLRPVDTKQCRLLCGPLQASFASSVGGQLNLNTLKSLLQELGLDKDAGNKQPAKLPLQEATAPEQQPRAVYARALVRRADGDDVQEVVAWRHVGAIVRNRESTADNFFVNLPDVVRDAGAKCGAQLIVYGTALPPGLAEQLLQKSQPSCAVTPAPLRRTAASLTPQEKQTLRQKHLWDPLPDGWYFSGTTYVDTFGSSEQMHPCMDEFVERYLDEQHAEAVRSHAVRAAHVNGFAPLVITDRAWWSAT